MERSDSLIAGLSGTLKIDRSPLRPAAEGRFKLTPPKQRFSAASDCTSWQYGTSANG